MQTLQAHLELSNDDAINLKFEGALDEEIRRALTKKLVDELLLSKELHIVKTQLGPTMTNPFQTGIRYSVKMQVHNASL